MSIDRLGNGLADVGHVARLFQLANVGVALRPELVVVLKLAVKVAIPAKALDLVNETKLY